MVKIIMHGCNGHMGQVITQLVEKDPEIEIVAGIDLNDCRDNGYPVFTANCRGEKYMVRLSIMGRHNVLNAMVALAVADLSGVPLSGAVKSLAAFTGFKNRQQIAEKNGVTFIEDVDTAAFQQACQSIYDNLKANDPDVYAIVEKIQNAGK